MSKVVVSSNSRGKNVGWWPVVVVLAAKNELPNSCVTFRGFNEHVSQEMVNDRIIVSLNGIRFVFKESYYQTW